MEQGITMPLVDPFHHFYIPTQFTGQTVGRLQLIKSLNDRDLAARSGEALGLDAVTALNIPADRAHHLERTAKNALATPQKIGRTVKSIVFSSRHRYLPYNYGHETP